MERHEILEAMSDLILNEVRKTVDNRAMKSFTKSLKIVAAQLGDNATVMGANYVDEATVVDGNLVTARGWFDNTPLLKEFLRLLKVNM